MGADVAQHAAQQRVAGADEPQHDLRPQELGLAVLAWGRRERGTVEMNQKEQ